MFTPSLRQMSKPSLPPPIKKDSKPDFFKLPVKAPIEQPTITIPPPPVKDYKIGSDVEQLIVKLQKLGEFAKELSEKQINEAKISTFVTNLRQLDVFLLKCQFPNDQELRETFRTELQRVEKLQNSPGKF